MTLRFPLLVGALVCALAAPSYAIKRVHVHGAQKHKTVAGAPAPTAVKPPHLNYYGGRVISNVKVVPVFWGPSVDAQVQKQIGQFYSDFVQSSMFDWLSEYDTSIKAVTGKSGTGQHIGKGSAVAPITITPTKVTKAGVAITDANIQAEIQAQIKKNVLPKPDLNTIYMVHFAHGQTIKSGDGLSCAAFCAYHGTIGTNIYYGVMPDEGVGSGCDKGCGSGGVFGNLTASAAHEIVEAVTDAQIGAVKGNKIVAPAAWYDPDKDATGHEYAEIGDICSDYEAPITTNGRTWTVQKMWSNKANGCIVQSGDRPQVIVASTTAPTGKRGGDSKAGKAKGKPTKKTAPVKRHPIAG